MSFYEAVTLIGAEDFRAEAEIFLQSKEKIEHSEVLREILDNLQEIDFRQIADLSENERVTQKHLRVITIQEILRVSGELHCGLCRYHDFIYGFNGEFWQLLDRDRIENFLGEAAQKLGVDPITSRDYEFKTKLFKQFLADAYLPKPEARSDIILINLQNGTFEINGDQALLRQFRRDDFLNYQLPFLYDEKAECPKFQNFLNEVLPEKSKQLVLAEYFGYVFTKLKLEKTLILYGAGANGKSVVFEIINAVLGKENISNYSLESLGENYFRAMIANKLLNYSSEISNRLQAEKFKQLTSGEPIEARLPYGQPMVLTNYARLAFNCNELPKDVEHSEAYFRRFLIIPFEVTVPEQKRNPNLSQEIIKTELSGIFNWILAGLQRVLQQRGFTHCDAARKALETYRRESDSVAMFLDEEGYEPTESYSIVKSIFQTYRSYCLENGYKPLGRINCVFRRR